MGLGHVPQDATGAEGSRAELQGPQHRRVARQQHLSSPGVSRARANQALANQARARFAEDLVAAWYVTEGYEVIARNWRCPRGELDIVAWRNNVLVVCEVKARRNACASGGASQARRAARTRGARLRQGSCGGSPGTRTLFALRRAVRVARQRLRRARPTSTSQPGARPDCASCVSGAVLRGRSLGRTAVHAKKAHATSAVMTANALAMTT
ncbi:MAG: YraN family protein [Actinobacteria bacterium]|nr:YraN family protein [Actinomycetota bacterium]